MTARWVDEAGRRPGLRASEKAVLFCLAYHAAEDGRVRLSILFMCDWTGLSHRTVWRTLRTLELHGLVAKWTRSGRTTRCRLVGAGLPATTPPTFSASWESSPSKGEEESILTPTDREGEVMVR
jgi:hypothetical protein